VLQAIKVSFKSDNYKRRQAPCQPLSYSPSLGPVAYIIIFFRNPRHLAGSFTAASGTSQSYGTTKHSGNYSKQPYLNQPNKFLSVDKYKKIRSGTLPAPTIKLNHLDKNLLKNTMSFFNFFKKKENRAEKLEAFERLLTQTTRWKYRGIHRTYLDVDFGPAFLEDIALDKSKPVTLADLRHVGRVLREQGKTFSKEEIEALSRQVGFNAWEAFCWDKEYLETIRNISTLSFQ
jgi:hypothetical protein